MIKDFETIKNYINHDYDTWEEFDFEDYRYGINPYKDIEECRTKWIDPLELKIRAKKHAADTKKRIKEKKEDNNNMMNNNFFNGMFGPIGAGMCRMSIDGSMAVKTSNGYKTYDVKSGSLMNCDNFVFDIGSEFFFLIPTNHVEPGDVIMASGKPHCVIEAKPNEIKAMRYEDGTIVFIVPERHMFMKKTYYYGKIVSMFGDMSSKGNKGMKAMMKYMMMSQMMKGSANSNNAMANMMPMMMMMNGGGMEDMFGGVFDFDDDEPVAEETEE